MNEMLGFINNILREKRKQTRKIKKALDVEFVLKALCAKSGVFKYPKVFQCHHESEFRIALTKQKKV